MFLCEIKEDMKWQMYMRIFLSNEEPQKYFAFINSYINMCRWDFFFFSKPNILMGFSCLSPASLLMGDVDLWATLTSYIDLK